MPRTKIPEGIVAADVIEATALFSSKSVSHDFHESEKFDVIVEGKRFPPKAILGLAAMRILGMPLKPSDFSGGEGSPCFNILRGLGFAIILKSESNSTGSSDWSEAEIDATVSAYLSMLSSEIAGTEFSKAEVNRQLRATSLTSRTKSSVEYRMQNISSVLQGLKRSWIAGYQPAANVGSGVTRKIVDSLERLGALKREDGIPDSDTIALSAKELAELFASESDHEKLDQKVRRIKLLRDLPKPDGAINPLRATRSVEQIERNPLVKAWVLREANGVCELCEQIGPFTDSEGQPFLEVHHIKPLAEDGADMLFNAVALCPNCHRRCHYGSDKQEIAVKLALLRRDA